MVHFRKRIGKPGAEKIFQASIEIRKDEIRTLDKSALEQYAELLMICNKVVKQRKQDKNKIFIFSVRKG